MIVELPKMLRPKDIQEHLGIGRDKAYALINLASFPKITIGREFLIPYEDYIEWLKKNNKKRIII